jgi:hypothetical protein
MVCILKYREFPFTGSRRQDRTYNLEPTTYLLQIFLTANIGFKTIRVHLMSAKISCHDLTVLCRNNFCHAALIVIYE